MAEQTQPGSPAETGETQEETQQEEVNPTKEKKVSAKKLAAALAEVEKIKAELEKAKSDAAHWKNEYYKAFADTQNLRRALEAEQRNIIRYRAEGFLDGLIPALDAFHMALDAPAPTKEAANYQIGFTYIYNQIIQVLANEGLTEIAPKPGDPFDANFMNAIEAVESEEVEPGRIVKVHAKGYRLHDRLIRAAMVTVSKAKEEPRPETPEPEQPPQERQPAEDQPAQA